MAEDPQAPTTTDAGITPAATEPAVAPAPSDGQGTGQIAADTGQALSTPTDAAVEDTFFDPKTLTPELMPAYKQMQAAYTRKTQEIAKNRTKVEAYDAFMSDPIGQIQQLAQQYGLSVTRGQAAQMMQGQQTPQPDQAPTNWEPQTWEDVMARAEERVMGKVMQQFTPVMTQVQQIRAKGIETQLNEIDPNWRVYEDDMRQTMAQHPTLVNDVGKLYRLSVPEDVQNSRAVQTALKKLESKTQAATMASKGSSPRTAPVIPKASTFEEAVQIAKQQLAEQGR